MLCVEYLMTSGMLVCVRVMGGVFPTVLTAVRTFE